MVPRVQSRISSRLKAKEKTLVRQKHYHVTREKLTNNTDETMMTIHINADLRPVVNENVGMLHWVMDPRVSGFIIAYSLSGNQVMICNFDVSFLFHFAPVFIWGEVEEELEL
jgi:hypothetical protein